MRPGEYDALSLQEKAFIMASYQVKQEEDEEARETAEAEARRKGG